jgi:hypothetical protein
LGELEAEGYSWTPGRLNIDGEMTAMLQLEEAISKLSK